MGQDPLTSTSLAAPTGWRLAPGYDSSAQGLIVSGFGHLPSAEALFLRQVQAGGAWLTTLDRIAPITAATGRMPRAATIAFTSTGLTALGIDGAVLATFDGAFQQGMSTPERSRRLGDASASAVVNGGRQWGGNAQSEPNIPHGIHALLLLYGRDGETVRAWAAETLAALAPSVVCERRLGLDLHADERGVPHEHFGFADGLSQPMPYGAAIVQRDGSPAPRDKWHAIASGDVLLGHLNAHLEPASSPYVADDPAARRAGLPPGSAPAGSLDLGLNGSYLVVRELQQDVSGFWRSMDRCAAEIREAGAAAHVTADWLAERVVGRDRHGNLLCPARVSGAELLGPSHNAVGFFDTDRFGQGCPLGSHVRRANPRDGLSAAPEFRQVALDASNNHRMIRRGRKFGPKAASRHQADGQDRGLLFMGLNTDLVRQFEFVQQNWIMNPNFATLRDQTDPLIGPAGLFTLNEVPLRRIVNVENFIRLAGGEYFFLPSLPAISYLRALGPG